MPGQFQLSIDELVEEAKQARDLGIGGIILFGIPDKKDDQGSDALHQCAIDGSGSRFGSLHVCVAAAMGSREDRGEVLLH